MRNLWLFIAALLLMACSQPKGDGVITGRVAHEGVGIPMSVVEAYTRPEQDRTTPPVAETVTGDEGRFELTMDLDSQLPRQVTWTRERAVHLELGGEKKVQEVTLTGTDIVTSEAAD